MSENHRLRKINETLRQAISDAISHNIQDPHLGFTTITAVTTSPDLRHADVLFTVLGDEDTEQETLETLKRSAGILQAHLAAKLRMKYTPTLTFFIDEDAKQARRIDEILSNFKPNTQ